MSPSHKKLGRTVGLLFLAIMIAGPFSLNLRGLSTSMFESATFYTEISANALQMRFSILLDILAALISMGIAVVLYPVMKVFNTKLALWYIGLFITYLAVIFYSDIDRLSLISLSENLAASSDPENWNKLGLVLMKSYIQAHFISLIIYSAASMLLYYFLLITRMVPVYLAVWGLVAVLIVFIATWFQIFGVDVAFYFYIQNGVFMLVFTGWLLAKGFTDASTKTRNSDIQGDTE